MEVIVASRYTFVWINLYHRDEYGKGVLWMDWMDPEEDFWDGTTGRRRK